MWSRATGEAKHSDCLCGLSAECTFQLLSNAMLPCVLFGFTDQLQGTDEAKSNGQQVSKAEGKKKKK